MYVLIKTQNNLTIINNVATVNYSRVNTAITIESTSDKLLLVPNGTVGLYNSNDDSLIASYTADVK